MASKRILMLLSIVCVLTLVFSISSTPVAGGDESGSKNYKTDGTWVVHSLYFGTLMTETNTSDGNASGRSSSSLASIVKFDPTLGGLYPDAAPGQTPLVVTYHRTGQDTYEGSNLHYVINNDLSIAYLFIGKAKGRWIDENTRVTSNLLYCYNGENTNLLGMPPNIGPDGMPIDDTDIYFALPDLVIHKRLNALLPALDPPADHFPLP